MFAQFVSLFVFCSSFLLSQQARAGGWVKAPGEYYTKLGARFPATAEPKSESESEWPDLQNKGDEQFKSTSSDLSLYAEMGVPNLWPMHVSIQGSYKKIRRASLQRTDSFESASFTDLKAVTTHGLYSGPLALDGKLQLAAAGRLGFVAPTTPQKFRFGKEAKRLGDVPAERGELLTGVDRGLFASVMGARVSVSLTPVWLALDLDAAEGWDFEYSSRELSAALGVELPLRSWFQVSVRGLRSSSPLIILDASQTNSDASARPAISTDLTYSASLGLTVFKGLALEADAALKRALYEKWVESHDQIKDHMTYSIGISYRSL